MQLDESTDVSSCAQQDNICTLYPLQNFKDEFPFCNPLESHTRGIYVFMKVDTFLMIAILWNLSISFLPFKQRLTSGEKRLLTVGLQCFLTSVALLKIAKLVLANLCKMTSRRICNKMDECIYDNHDAAQEEFIKLVNDSGAQELFPRVDLPSFWSSLLGSYPIVSDMALKLLIPFPSTYLCEAAFSSILVIKTKARNRLDIEPDLRCCLAVTEPRIQKLVEKQHQKSH